jgi:hypothetical protein
MISKIGAFQPIKKILVEMNADMAIVSKITLGWGRHLLGITLQNHNHFISFMSSEQTDRNTCREISLTISNYN